MFGGEILDIMPGSAATKEQLGLLMAGVRQPAPSAA